MPIKVDYGDLPITTPEQDMFGVDGFVRSLAQSVRNMRSPQGVVIALNGPWGSGKSSAINLLKHHLAEATTSGDLQIVDFNPWWFRGEEALVLAFFRELYAATNPSLGDKAKNLLPKLGARLLKAGGVVAPIADTVGAAGVGAVASGVMGWLSGMIEDGESVEKLHGELSTALAGQNKRFVIIIDDIDRLTPDEALAMFRLVKSVGRLPNLIYILAFDRMLAERVVAERFPSEGPHYLEKIIQAAFELPSPLESDLHRHTMASIEAIVGGVDQSRIVHIMNMFYEVVAPEMKTPRDATRYVNALTITWPAVEGEVDVGDFIAIEAYRLFKPAIYQALRSNQSVLCGRADWGIDRAGGADRLDALLLSGVVNKEPYRRALARLFPRLDVHWRNTTHGTDGEDRDRRISSAQHFQTYFRMSIDPDVISKKEITAFLTEVADANAVSSAMLRALDKLQRDGSTRAKALLDAVINHASDIPISNSTQLLIGLFSIADRINVEPDKGRGFDLGSNDLRLHWLIRAIFRDRTTLAERSAILINACDVAELGWLGNIAHSAWQDYHPRDGKPPEPEDQCITTEADASALRQLFLDRVRQAAADGTLIEANDFMRPLYLWLHFEDDDAAVRSWLKERVEEDSSLIRLARACTTHGWQQSAGDVVAKRKEQASIDGLKDLIDLSYFRSKLNELWARLDPKSDDAGTVSRFLAAWDRRDRDGYW